MALDPRERYASVNAFADDVEPRSTDARPPRTTRPLLTQAVRYYFGRDPAVAQLKTIDLDLWILGGAARRRRRRGVFRIARRSVWWELIVLGALLALPPSVRYFRARRQRVSSRR